MCNNKIQLENITELEEYYDESLKNKNIVITIFCLTYNHAAYIKRTFEGFIEQKFEGNIEVLVFDDASTDGTSEIVREYALKYPNLFHAIIAKSNTYNCSDRNRAFINFFKCNLRGKYATICEGDDYWIYDKKLQRQYDLMESMPNVSMCYHNAIRYDKNTDEVIPQIFDMDSGIIDENEIFGACLGVLSAASLMFKSKYWRDAPHFFDISPVGDEPLRFWCAYNGDIYYLDKCWSVRNFMHEGSWNAAMKTSVELRKKFNIGYMQFVQEYYEVAHDKFHDLLSKMLIGLCESEFYAVNLSEMTVEQYDIWYNKCRMAYGNKCAQLFDEAYIRFKLCIKGFFENLIKKNTKQKIIYGAGNFGRKLKYYFDDLGVKVDRFCQTNIDAETQDKVENIKVIDINELKKDRHSKQIFIAIDNFEVCHSVKENLLSTLGRDDEIYDMRNYIRYMSLLHKN